MDMSDKATIIEELKTLIESFVDERDWKQFHSPKNLAMSISIEAAELMELFQWLSLDEAKEVMKVGELRAKAIDEIADIMNGSWSDLHKNISTQIPLKMVQFAKLSTRTKLARTDLSRN